MSHELVPTKIKNARKEAWIWIWEQQNVTAQFLYSAHSSVEAYMTASEYKPRKSSKSYKSRTKIRGNVTAV
jgi:hypothetical protein